MLLGSKHAQDPKTQSNTNQLSKSTDSIQPWESIKTLKPIKEKGDSIRIRGARAIPMAQLMPETKVCNDVRG